MTINDLIEKLKSEKHNGMYDVLRTWLASIKKLRKEVEDEKDPRRQLYIRDRMNRVYDTASGFMWGLFSTDYISDGECRELLDELIKAAHG